MRERPGLRTLTQTFSFPDASCDEVAAVLADAPLVGDRSIFGNRFARSTTTAGDVRRVLGFRPAPGPLLSFDVEMTQRRPESGVMVLVDFGQPTRTRPYLDGQFVWFLTDTDGGGAVLREEINTDAALEVVERPLHGSRFSLRRLLFFSGGHQQVMKAVAANIRALLDTEHPPPPHR